MPRYLLATTALAALMFANTAQAADLARKPVLKAPPPVAAPFSWTGFYIGAHGGYGWGKNKWSDFVDPLNPLNSVAGPDAHYDIDGGLAGGQIGYNWQMGWTVLGIEADASWANIKGSGTTVYPELGNAVGCLQSGDPCTSKIEALGTITGRLGAALDRTLLYVKAGAAWAHEKHTAGFTVPVEPGFNYSASKSDTRWGWTIGAGLEYAFAPNWSAKIEYNYIDLGKDRISFTYAPPQPFGASAKLDQSLHLIKAGLNYRF